MTLTSKSYQPIRRNWLDIPSDIMVDIFSRVGAIDLLENAQKVCTAWRKICKSNPDIWRVIYLENYWDPTARHVLRMICWEAVCRSQGRLVDLTIVDFCNDDLLFCVTERSSQLRSLDISCSRRYLGDISVETIQSVGRHCPMLETLKMNKEAVVFSKRDYKEGEADLRIYNDTATAIAIGENLCQLKHLELIGNNMTDHGLKAILDGCPNIELLDLRRCNYIDLNGDLVERCLHQIKYLEMSNDFVDSTACNVTTGYDSDNDDDDDYYNEDNDGYYNEDNGPLYSDSEEFAECDNVADNDDDDDDFPNF